MLKCILHDNADIHRGKTKCHYCAVQQDPEHGEESSRIRFRAGEDPDDQAGHREDQAHEHDSHGAHGRRVLALIRSVDHQADARSADQSQQKREPRFCRRLIS